MARAPVFRRRHRLRRAALGLVLWIMPLVVGAGVCLSDPRILENLRNLIFDNYQRIEPRVWTPDLPVRVIDIDDASLEKIGQWPWPRKHLAKMAEQLSAQGAAVIVFDVLFSEEDRLTPENMLTQLPDIPERAALGKALVEKGLIEADTLPDTLAKMPAVLAFVLTENGTPRDIPIKTGFATVGDDPIPFLGHFHSSILPLRALIEKTAGLGGINWIPDRDLIIRKAPLALALDVPEGGKMLVPSLDAEALRVAQGADTILIKSSNASGEQAYGVSTGIVSIKIGDALVSTESDGMVRIRFAGSRTGRHIPAWRVLAGETQEADINGKIILIGSSAAALSDLRSTPLEAAVPGIDIHAELLEHIATGVRLARPDYATGLETMLLILGGLSATLLARLAGPIPAALFTFVLIAGFSAASFFAFSRADLLFDPIMPSATVLAAYTTMTVSVYWRSERQRRFVRQAFGRYLAPALVERLAKDPDALKLGGESREVSVLFSDIRGFTARAENLNAQEVVQFLNSLHTPLTEIVLAENGTLDKYIGDGLMAFWNAPADVPNHADHACRAALAMCRAVNRIDAEAAGKAELGGNSHVQIDIGVGISSGEVFVGNMGSQHRFDYSIVGDNVNIAARLESATKTLGVSILVSEATAREATGFLFLPLGRIEVKGKSLPLKVYTLHGPKSDAGDFESFALLHGEVVAAMERSDASLNEAVAKACAHPQGRIYAKFYARCLSGFA